MKEVFSFKERDKKLSALSNEQQLYIKEYITQRKKSRFANIMANFKGQVLPKYASDIEIEEILDGWMLADYIDNGTVNSDTRCECGAPLRYQYIVKHTRTHEVKRLGIEHFKEHTNFSPELIKLIKKGLTEIDYELDELLLKIDMKWLNDEQIREYPQKVPNDIQKHLQQKLPLLNRHINRLSAIIDDERKKEFFSSDTRKKEEQTSLFEADPVQDQKSPTDLTEEEQAILLAYVKSGISDSLYLTQILIDEHGANKATYEYTGRPKLFAVVTIFLSDKAREGLLIEEQIEKGIKLFRYKDQVSD